MAAVGSAQLASYYDAPRVPSSALARTGTSMWPRHPHSSERDARSRNFRVFPMAQGSNAQMPSTRDRGGNAFYEVVVPVVVYRLADELLVGEISGTDIKVTIVH